MPLRGNSLRDPVDEYPVYPKGSREYEANRVAPDLYKIQSPMQLRDGKLTLQIQEIEHEESFINGFELMRVTHPSTSEIVVDSEFRRFYAYDKKELSDSFIQPTSIVSKDGQQDVSHITSQKNFWEKPESHAVFNKNDYIDMHFSDLSPGETYHLALKSNHRVWIMGEDPSVLNQARYKVSSFVRSNFFSRAAEASLVVLGLWFAKEAQWLSKEAPILASLIPMMGIGMISNQADSQEKRYLEDVR